MTLKEVYDQHFERIYTFIFSLVQSEQDALELTFEVFMAYHRAELKYQPIAHSFLMITARNATLNFLQSKKESA